MTEQPKTNGVSGAQILAYIERVEKMEAEKADIAEGIKDIYAELKGNGFDAAIVRKIVALRKKDRDKRREEMEILRLYCDAIQLDLGL